jgi:hypothetical protein
MEIVTAREEVCDQFFVVCRRVRRRGGGCRGSSLGMVEVSAKGGVSGIYVVKVTKTDDASVCH